ncbi:hypothetical protein [Amycolatopsis sp. cg13]|uniref:hypothetical protein n=1 Tax=Amycolatopsis sp. cg13 TaxID=3238807 RepID=UPI0035267C07
MGRRERPRVSVSDPSEWGRGEVEDRLQEEPLASLWQAELARRERLIARIDRFLGSNDERLAAMVLADWVRRGRTPREHKRYYDRFVAMAVRHFDDAEITTNMGMHYSVNRDSLPNWLDAVSSGKTFESATTTLAEKEHALARRMSLEDEKDLPDQVQGAWLAAGASWQLMLESMALAHPGSVLALFQRYGSEIDPDLIELVARLGPSASLEIAHIDWTVAVVPAACRVAFASSGRTGRLILLDNPGYRVTDETCELFLRNVVRAAGYPELAQHVRGRMPEQSEQSREVTDSEYDMARALSQRGFNTRGYGFGLTIGDCDTALRAAMQGEEFARPTVSRSRRSRR